ncbi:hypothetical protein LOK49_LG10G01404 [Camellia lanceoleosa]|uniref:Uncharacterized protein n=1 Tax=Camellia lanceoleosa TaxID=1840588 RepID=A0ACC0G9L1_9ERIC|nr:hypothetical protein LOK49_LG10G01404 [Camellia lanceoleosa]
MAIPPPFGPEALKWMMELTKKMEEQTVAKKKKKKKKKNEEATFESEADTTSHARYHVGRTHDLVEWRPRLLLATTKCGTQVEWLKGGVHGPRGAAVSDHE